MSDPLPSFDTNTESELKLFSSEETTNIHARELGTKKEFICDIGGDPRCSKPFKNSQGLGNHKRQKHQPKVVDVYDNDVIRLAFKSTLNPVWDAKNNVYVYPDEMKLPEDFLVLNVENGTTYINDTFQQGKKLVQHMTLVRKDKVVSK